MVKRIDKRPEQATPIVTLPELTVMRAAIMQLVSDSGGEGSAPGWVRDFARVVQTLAVTYQRVNELRRGTIEQAASIADECGATEAAERIRGIQ